MQTFLPFASYSDSVATLDRDRLGKQRVETYQILLQLLCVEVVSWEDRRWKPRPAKWHHPVMNMWAGSERQLLEYQRATCNEWTSRGYRDTCLEKSEWILNQVQPVSSLVVPGWIGDKHFHLSHQSNLLRKDEEHYRKFFPDTPVDLPYVWPRSVEDLKAYTGKRYELAMEEFHRPRISRRTLREDIPRKRVRRHL